MHNLRAAALIPGKPDDGGWAQASAEAVAALQAAGWQITAVPQPAVTPESARQAAEVLARNGIHLVIGHGCEYFEAFVTLAREHTQTCFFAMDLLAEAQDWPGNFGCLHQKQYEAAYLCGRLAAHMSGGGPVGCIGGQLLPTQLANGSAFSRGAQSLHPALEVFTECVCSFEDAAAGDRLAAQMIERGARVLMHTASETGNGVIEACRQRDVPVIGYTLDQRHLAPAQMLTSLVVDVTRIYRHKLEETAAGAFQPGVWRVGLAEGMVGLAPLSSRVPAAAARDLEQTTLAIVDGTLSVSP